MTLIENNADAAQPMIDVRKLIAQLPNATVIIQKLPSIKGHLRLVRIESNKENENSNENNQDDEFFFKEPGKKRASKVSKPFCSTCNITIENHKARNKHCLECGTRLLFKCMTCRTQYTSYRGMQMHLKTQCDETTFYIQCSVCDYATNSKLALTKHIKNVHQNLHKEVFEEFNPDKRSYKCTFCEKVFKFRSNLTNHLKFCKTKHAKCLSNNENILESRENKLISNQTSSETNLIGYSVKHQIKTKTQSMIKYRCLKCNKTKKNISRNRAPKCGKCNSRLSLSCKKCSKQYDSYESMKYHLSSKCSPAALYQCSMCSYKSTMKELIKKHIKNIHVTTVKRSPTKCPKCEAECRNPLSLQKHIKFCGVPPNFFCKLCSYKTRFKQNLKVHLLSQHHAEVNKHNFTNFIKDIRTENIVEPLACEKIDNNKNNKPCSANDTLNMLKICCPMCKKETEISGNVSKKCLNCESSIFFKCKKCSKPISNFYNAKAHVQSCLTFNKTCKYCQKHINDCDKFKQHLEYCKLKSLKCQHCFYWAKNKADMYIHKTRTHIKFDRRKKVTKPVEIVQKAENEVEDKDITSKMATNEIVQVTQNESNEGTVIKMNKIKIIKKQIVDHVPTLKEMASRICPKCERLYEGSATTLKSFCNYCNDIELYHRCRKCEKRYNHSASLIFHLRNVCFPTVQYTCSICNYSTYMKTIMVKHAKNRKHKRN